MSEVTIPTWAKVVGIIGVCFGAMRVMGAGYDLMMPKMLEMQQQMMESFSEAAESSEPAADSDHHKMPPQMAGAFKGMAEMMAVPPWFGTWSIATGIIGLVIGGLYVLSSIFLLLPRPGAPRLFIGAATLSILRNLVGIAVGVTAGSFMLMSLAFSGAFGIVIDVVLIIVVLVSDRSAYETNSAT